MTHLLKQHGYYYYHRRVPAPLKSFDSRKVIRVSLWTACKQKAREKALLVNQRTEEYWRELIANNIRYDKHSYKKAVAVAIDYGFNYQPMQVVAAMPIMELMDRILKVVEGSPNDVAHVLGGKTKGHYPLSLVIEKFWEITQNKLYNKSSDQIRKWKNPRRRAIKNLISIIGDKEITQVSRDDMLQFQKWWIDKMVEEELTVDSPNKDFINIQVIIETVSKHLKLKIEIKEVYSDLLLKKRHENERPPFTTEQILSILNDPKLDNLNKEARYAFYACAETGARPSEIVGLLPEDIILNDPIPHIIIRDRHLRNLKTVDSNRVIPLVGYALEAFMKMPDGFPSYRAVPDNFTNAVNKFLLENDLRPTDRHTMYSLRHSFQDRLTEVNAPDRIQTQLMGHKFISRFKRVKYGKGASLKVLQKFMNKIKIM